jgi:hypothetical protein
MRDHPPRAAVRLLRWLVPGRDGDVVSGDLRETYLYAQARTRGLLARVEDGTRAYSGPPIELRP